MSELTEVMDDMVEEIKLLREAAQKPAELVAVLTELVAEVRRLRQTAEEFVALQRETGGRWQPVEYNAGDE